MSKINFDLDKDLLIYEGLEKTINELKIYYKVHPNTLISYEQDIKTHLGQQIDCLKRINKNRMNFLRHVLYAIKRYAKKYELYKLEGTLKTHLRTAICLLALGIAITTNYSSSSKELEISTIEKLCISTDDLSALLENISNEIIIEEQKTIISEYITTIQEYDFAENIKEAKISKCESYLEEYSCYFNFDSEKVIELARTLTNDFENQIAIRVGNKEVVSINPETMAMVLVLDLYKKPSKYALTREELTTTDEICHLEYNDEGKIILRNGLFFSQFLGKVCDSIESDKCLALAISNHESGYQTNPQSINQNNFGGWRHDEEALTFPSPEAGIIYHCFALEKMLNTRDYDNLSEFSGIYTKNNKELPSPSWVEDVSSKTSLYAANEDEYFNYENNSQNTEEIMLTKNINE